MCALSNLCTNVQNLIKTKDILYKLFQYTENLVE